MPENPSEPSEPLDVRTIHHLVRLMKRYDLTAIDFIEGSTKIRLRRQGPELAPAAHASPAPLVAAPLAATATKVESAPTAPAQPAGILLRSPMVGTFYSASTPDAPPFVTVGSFILPESTVCVIEAMKVFTDIPAGVSGTVIEVLVKNGQPVEFDQPMFRVNPA
jgi:acetyl-CoA carboxylase biotin carboxyl carrier protein